MGDGQTTASTAGDENSAPAFHSDSFPGSSLEEATSDSISTADDTTYPPYANFPRSHSQFLVPAAASDDPYGMMTSSSQSDNFNGGVGMHMSESLQNLSKAITHRQKSETGQESLASSSASLPSLVDRINDVQILIDKYMKEQERQLKSKENEINELKTKFLKHRQILVSNYEQAESEILRLDEIYHDTVEQVLRGSQEVGFREERQLPKLPLQSHDCARTRRRCSSPTAFYIRTKLAGQGRFAAAIGGKSPSFYPDRAAWGKEKVCMAAWNMNCSSLGKCRRRKGKE
ncbi:unnamed protein product [Sphagnum tenellum]